MLFSCPMYLRIFTIIALLSCHFAVGATTPSPSFREQCEASLKPNSLDVSVDEGDIQYDLTKSLQHLKRMHGAGKAPQEMPRNNVLGLTHAKMAVGWSMNIHMLENPDTGETCGRFQLKAHLQAGVQTVFIAREIPEGTCAFDHVVEHEHEHVDTNTAHLHITAKQIENYLPSVFGQTVVYAKTKNELKKALNSYISDEISPFVISLINEVDGKHAKIDLPAVYERNNTACDGQIPELLKNAKS